MSRPLSWMGGVVLNRPVVDDGSYYNHDYKIKVEETECEDDLSTPSSPSSTYSTSSTPSIFPSPYSFSSTPSTPYLSSSFPSFSHLSSSSISDLRISDNSHSTANPSQRKKGGCKSITLLVHVGSLTFSVGGKCDVRKSFSNRSFSKYYDRGQYGIVTCDSEGNVVLVIEEGKKGRDGKWFVAMEKGCTPPFSAEEGNPRHPLLAFAADAVYRLTVLTKGEEEVKVEVKCMFEQGSATVSKREGKGKRKREVKEEVEEGEEGREKKGRTISIERPLSVSSSSSSLSSEFSFPSSPCLSPLSPSSSLSSASSLPSSPSASPSPSSFQISLDPSYCASSDEFLDEAAFVVSPAFCPSGLFCSSPLMSPMTLKGYGGGIGMLSPYGGWMGGLELPEFELK